MDLIERVYNYTDSSTLPVGKNMSVSDYIKLLRSVFKDVYDIKIVKTDKELVVLFFSDDLLSHVTTYDLCQFKTLEL